MSGKFRPQRSVNACRRAFGVGIPQTFSHLSPLDLTLTVRLCVCKWQSKADDRDTGRLFCR